MISTRWMMVLWGIGAGCFELGIARAETRELILISPHWEGIQFEFTQAFQDYYRSKFGVEVRIRWRDVGGTSQIEKALNATYSVNPESSGIDVFFGGGIDPFESQKEKGHLARCPLPADVAEGIPEQLGGMWIRDPDEMFYGAALSSFGILENRRVVQILGLPEVRDWRDLTDPRLMGWVSSTDPRKSGSVHMIYEIILQAYGWEEGWSIIYRMSGNLRSFTQNSSAATKEVGTGDAAYAVAIDINGLTAQAFLGVENVRFRIPQGVSMINPDGIAMLKGAPNEDVAREFIAFVMSERGQRLWMTPRGEPNGPTKFDISRMSVRPALYEGDWTGLMVPLNPFAVKFPFAFDNATSARRWGVVNDLIGQSIIDLHSRLVAAWRAIHTLPEHQRKDLVDQMCQPLVTEQEALELSAFWRTDKLRARRLANQWMDQSAARYAEILRQVRERSRGQP